MNLDDALKTFIIESRELLEQMEQALLKAEQSPEDADLINAIFRTAHTIKGSAGLFGLDHVVAFTHHAENVLDKVRATELRLSRELVVLLFDVCDHLGSLIDYVDKGHAPSSEVHTRSEELIHILKGHINLKAGPTTLEATKPAVNSGLWQGDSAETENWHLSLRFTRNVLRNGMDPVAFVRYLNTFGKIVHIVTLTDVIPVAALMDAEDFYLGFEINYSTDVEQIIIESAFEFVNDDSSIYILPPHCNISEYENLIKIRSLESDGENNLGEVLVRCDSLTKSEFEKINSKNTNSANELDGVALPLSPESAVVCNLSKDKSKPIKESKTSDSALIRVSAEKLDEHINLIGELIIASAGINLAAVQNGTPELLEAASVINRLVENVRESAMQLRMVQIGATFNKFQRLVRDISKEIGKDIILEINGAETELDKTVIEKISDPLTHLVRNAIDHGIESAAARLACGKPAQGTLRLNAYHDSGSIAIEVSDDGGGLPKDRIFAKAIERGLVQPEQVLSNSEIYNLIFEPGFSTAAQVNNLSGRGVGMDVVRRNITTLRGTTEIESTEGIGTTIRIRLPLTLAIIDGFLVGVGKSSFVIPLEIVYECIELTTQEIEEAQGWNHLNLRGELLPLIHLKHIFEMGSDGEHLPESISSNNIKNIVSNISNINNISNATYGSAVPVISSELNIILEPLRRENVVVVHCAGRRVGIVVDALQGEYQTVIRPLGEVFDGLRGISGFTILGTGRVALILDIPSLMAHLAQVTNQLFKDCGNFTGSLDNSVNLVN